ncbi:MAG: efflux RND transporter periplasmic adaptor subunit [Bdellovibrionales bacterium]|nr:efflux RND transporter periplasmic adaptor subunit [Bdellovibrionales bacterium]
MKNKVIILIVVILGFGTFFWWNYGHRNRNEHSAHQNSHQEVKYICPMHPQITSNKPGTCPICGMDLVLASEMEDETDHSNHKDESDEVQPSTEEHSKEHQGMQEDPHGRAPVKLTLNKQQMIGVKLAKIEEKNLFKSIKAPGRIAFDPELYTAQSEYLEALKQWSRVKNSPINDVKENTKQMIKSSKIRLRVLGLSDDQIDALTSKGSQSEGLLVGGGDNIVYADVFEVELPYIKEGQSAQISASFLQGRTIPGKVISVDRVISPETRTAKVRIELLKSDSSIRPESYVNVIIFAPLGKHLSVPLEAIMDTGTDQFVFINKGEGKFEPKNVRILIETASEAAIAGSISSGDEVVVGANFLIDSESRLRSVIQGGSSSSSGHNH